MSPPRGSSDEVAQTRWESVVDKAIAEAQRRGEFDDLPGAGQPLRLEENPFAGDWAMAFHALKSAGVAPHWIEAGKEVRDEIAALKGLRERTARFLREQSAARTEDAPEGSAVASDDETPLSRWAQWPWRRHRPRDRRREPGGRRFDVADLEAERLRVRQRYLERAAKLDEKIRAYNAALPNDLWRLHRGRVTASAAAQEFDAACPPLTAESRG